MLWKQTGRLLQDAENQPSSRCEVAEGGFWMPV